MSPEEIQAFAAVATFLAAAVAVWATFQAPRLAAEFAERLRHDASVEDESRRLKLAIFTNLLQYRADIGHPLSAASLNLIDVAFVNSPEVRLAFRHFHEAAAETPYLEAMAVERYLAIIEKIARDLGLSGSITVQDIQRVYYSRKMQEADMAAALDAQERLSRHATAAALASTHGPAISYAKER